MKLAIIRVDGSKNIGMGHLIREIDIAKELENLEYEVVFLSKDFKEGISYLEKNHFTIKKLLPHNLNIQNSKNEMRQILNQFERKISLIIVDLLDFFDEQEYLDTLKEFCNNLIIITDKTEPFYVKANVVFALSQHQKKKNYVKEFDTQYYTGLDYFPLNKKYSNLKSKKISNKKVKNVLITFGGTDSVNYSTRVIKLLKNIHIPVKFTLIVGPGFSKENNSELIEVLHPNIILKRNIKDMLGFFKKTDLCICSAGNTLLELLTCGIPCIVLPQTKREEDHAQAFENKEVIINLGIDWTEDKLISTLKELISNYKKRRDLSIMAQKYFDGLGLKRMIEKIVRNYSTE